MEWYLSLWLPAANKNMLNGLFTFLFIYFLRRAITALKIHYYLSFAELVYANIYRKGKLMFGRNTH